MAVNTVGSTHAKSYALLAHKIIDMNSSGSWGVCLLSPHFVWPTIHCPLFYRPCYSDSIHIIVWYMVLFKQSLITQVNKCTPQASSSDIKMLWSAAFYFFARILFSSVSLNLRSCSLEHLLRCSRVLNQSAGVFVPRVNKHTPTVAGFWCRGQSRWNEMRYRRRGENRSGMAASASWEHFDLRRSATYLVWQGL